MLSAVHSAFLPSPPAGYALAQQVALGGLRFQRKTDEGSLKPINLGETPHPALRATFSSKGRRVICSGTHHA